MAVPRLRDPRVLLQLVLTSCCYPKVQTPENYGRASGGFLSFEIRIKVKVSFFFAGGIQCVPTDRWEDPGDLVHFGHDISWNTSLCWTVLCHLVPAQFCACLLCHDWIIQIYLAGLGTVGTSANAESCTNLASKIVLRQQRWPGDVIERLMATPKGIKRIEKVYVSCKTIFCRISLFYLLRVLTCLVYVCPHCFPLILMKPSMLLAVPVLETVVVDGCGCNHKGETKEIDCEPGLYIYISLSLSIYINA